MTAVTERLYTFNDYLAYDDGTDNRYELFEGRLELMNPPTIKHFLIAKFIERLLDIEIKNKSLPWLCFKETGVRTGKNKSRLTDICVVTVEQAQELMNESAVFQSAPLLVIEIVSPESVKRDYRYKRSEYAALGIPEYWIIDPIENKVSLLHLDEGWYEEMVLTGNQVIISPTFPELTLTVDRVLAGGNLS